LKTLSVDPLTRVEGHGRVDLLLKKGQLVDARIHLLESPRFFEKLIVGRHYSEVPELICRICAICSSVHKLTALKALEKAFGLEIPPLAASVRDLLLLGGHIQSHALHLFCLVLPDFYEGLSVFELLQRQDHLAQAGLELKALGNDIQELAGGRVIHPVNPVPGGVVFRPDEEALINLLDRLNVWSERWPGLEESLLARAKFPHGAKCQGVCLATGGSQRFELSGDKLWHACQDEPLPVENYGKLIGEVPVEESHAKQAMGRSGPFLVGALARLRLAADRKLGLNWQDTEDNIHGNNIAQVFEIGWALKQTKGLILAILNAKDTSSLRLEQIQVKAGIGTAAMEAPRGLLIHHYVVDEWGNIAVGDVVTPTAINQRLMRQQIMADLSDITDARQLTLGAEKIIRSFDPCISCAVHVLHC
jgi:coenzyme F420-reducing hydrogenase alpha subunit